MSPVIVPAAPQGHVTAMAVTTHSFWLQVDDLEFDPAADRSTLVLNGRDHLELIPNRRYTIGGLEPDHTYEITMRSYNEAGRSLDSAPVIVTTTRY